MPSRWEAPFALLGITGNCGPISVWLMLRYFRKRVGAKRIVEATRHTERSGCYTIALALALHDFGLNVTFHTDPDPAIEPLEALCYKWARNKGIPIEPALTLHDLRHSLRPQLGIVYLATPEGDGHFSPLIGINRRMAILPNTEKGKLSLDVFEQRWSGPGYPRQCILVSG